MAKRVKLWVKQRKLGSAVGYVRVSTADQAEHGLSVETQTEKIRQYCKMKELGLVEVYSDLAVSGSKPLEERDGGASLLDYIRGSDVGHVVAMRLDRMFRDTFDCLGTVKKLKELGVGLHLLDLNLDTSTPLGEFFITVVAAFATLERNIISERVREGMATKKAQGKVYTSRLPIGLQVGSDGETVVPNHAEREAIDLILKLRRSGQSLNEIVSTLEELKIPARGDRWHKTTISRICKNKGDL